MSNYYRVIKNTKNPNNGCFEDAIWHYNYRGYICLVEFPRGNIFNPKTINLITK